MTENSHLSRKLRRQPKQERGRKKVEKILEAAAAVFDEVGYEAATTHQIAARAQTAVGSVYQFFPDKEAIFGAMELRHLERVQTMWAGIDREELVKLPLKDMIHRLLCSVAGIFEHPVSRVVFIQFFTARQIFHSIDDGMTREAIKFMSDILCLRNPNLDEARRDLIAEVCVHSSNGIILSALREENDQHRQLLTASIEELLVSYLTAYIDDGSSAFVMKVMKCTRCGSELISKNGYRRGKQSYLCKNCGRQFVETGRG